MQVKNPSPLARTRDALDIGGHALVASVELDEGVGDAEAADQVADGIELLL